MTPKEKATKLADAFYQYLPLEKYVTTSDGELSWEYSCWENAKQCALIAVEEIINVLSNELNPLVNYWFNVKQEIEKL